MQKRHWISIALLLVIALILQKQILHLKRKQKIVSSRVKELRFTPKAPLNFQDTFDIALSVKEVSIPKIVPYNPTLVKTGDGYDLIFRYDTFNKNARPSPFFSHIGVAHLDEHFNLKTEDIQTLNLGTPFAEDPCIVSCQDQLYLFYNEPDESHGRCVSLANVNPTNYQVNYTTQLDMNLKHVEKNWSPFVFSDRLFIEYQIFPRKLLELPNPKENDLRNVLLPKKEVFFPLVWEERWGPISGGAPAQKIGDEYLGFFHSSKEDRNGFRQFFMGAYTFESTPPFRLTGISKKPIFFDGIYTSPIIHTAPHNKRVIYPRGFVIQGDRIHLACGENDCAVKIVTLDLQKIKESLLPL